MEGIWKKRLSYLGALLTISLLLVGNVHLARKVFSSSHPSALPQLNVGIFEAASIALSQTRPSAGISWKEPRTILILGSAGSGHISPNLTDTIVLVHVDPRPTPVKVRLVSVPRDLLVKVVDPIWGEISFKANALWSYATSANKDPAEFIKREMGKITGTPVSNVVGVDLASVRAVVEKAGGITVWVEEDIYDPRFPSATGGYEEFRLQRGWRYLAAADALRFIRTRAASGGDFTRMEHQQEFLRALKGKLASLNPIWNFGTLWSLYEAVKDGVISDITKNDISNLWAVSEQVSLENIETMSVDGPSGLLVSEKILLGGAPADVLVPRIGVGEYAEIQSQITDFLAK